MAKVYDACAPLGLFSPVLDRMQFWEIASTLGMARAKVTAPQPDAPDFDPIAARVAAAERGEKLDPKAIKWGTVRKAGDAPS